MKKWKMVSLMLGASLLSLSTGAYAATSLQQITAYLNGEVKFLKDGAAWRPTDEAGNEVLPITYDGTTYLPLRVVANTFNVPVTYDAATNTVQLGKTGKGVTFYDARIRAEDHSLEFYDIIDKKQLIFGGKQYDGAYAFAGGRSLGDGLYMTLDFGEKYNTLHLIAVAKENMSLKVYNDANQELTGEINLIKGEVKDIAVDLQGSRYARVYGYTPTFQGGHYPLIYVLKDSYVTNDPISSAPEPPKTQPSNSVPSTPVVR